MAELKRPVISHVSGENNRLKRTLYVGGLDDNVDREILHAAFIPFGELRTVEIPKDRATGKHRGFGFVEFEEEEDASHAIDNMHESELFARILTVNLARTPARRPGEGSRAVWNDDAFLRQHINEDSVQVVQEEDMDLTALLQCSEAQEALRNREEARKISQAYASSPNPPDGPFEVAGYLVSASC